MSRDPFRGPRPSGTDFEKQVRQSFPRTLASASPYYGIVALAPLDRWPFVLPNWMRGVSREEVEGIIRRIRNSTYRERAADVFLRSSGRVRQFFAIPHAYTRTLGESGGRYRDQNGAAADIAAAVQGTLKNLWAAHPRRPMSMAQTVLIHVPDAEFVTVVELDHRQSTEEFPVRGLYELPPQLEPAVHWAHRSQALQSPEVAFVCAWVGAESLASHCSQRSVAPERILVERAVPILLLEEIRDSLREAWRALNQLLGIDLAAMMEANNEWAVSPDEGKVVTLLRSEEHLKALLVRCRSMPYVAWEIDRLAKRINDRSSCLEWFRHRGDALRRNVHRMKRLRNNIMHNAVLEASAAELLAEHLADYVRIASYRTAAVVRSTSCSLEEALNAYGRAWAGLLAALDAHKGPSVPDGFWRAALRVRDQPFESPLSPG